MSTSLGDTLARTRRALEKSLIEAASATKIRVKLLEALENGDYDALPNSAYVRGYIISYAKFLGLDPGPLLAMFAEEADPVIRHESVRLPEPVVPAREAAFVVPVRTVLVLSAIAVLVSTAIWGIGRTLAASDELPPVPTVPEPTQTTEPKPPPSSVVETPVVTTPTAGVPASQSFLLRVHVLPSATSWLNVTVDGLKAYEGTLVSGQFKEWEVLESAAIRVGRPSAVEITRDGEPVNIPDSADTPVVTLSAESITP